MLKLKRKFDYVAVAFYPVLFGLHPAGCGRVGCVCVAGCCRGAGCAWPNEVVIFFCQSDVAALLYGEPV